MWDGKDSVYAHVSAKHRNMTCGLCGNYNGFPDDDVMTYSRQQVSSIAKFGNSWRMTDVNRLMPQRAWRGYKESLQFGNAREQDTGNCHEISPIHALW